MSSEAPVTEAPKKIIPLSEISKHNTQEDCWMAINGKVYNVTKFIDQHPGGEEVILEHAGADATVPFEDVGHSDQAIEILEELYVGEGNPEELKITKKAVSSGDLNSADGSSSKLPLILGILVVGAAYFYFKSLSD